MSVASIRCSPAPFDCRAHLSTLGPFEGDRVLGCVKGDLDRNYNEFHGWDTFMACNDYRSNQHHMFCHVAV